MIDQTDATGRAEIILVRFVSFGGIFLAGFTKNRRFVSIDPIHPVLEQAGESQSVVVAHVLQKEKGVYGAQHGFSSCTSGQSYLNGGAAGTPSRWSLPKSL